MSVEGAHRDCQRPATYVVVRCVPRRFEIRLQGLMEQVLFERDWGWRGLWIKAAGYQRRETNPDAWIEIRERVNIRPERNGDQIAGWRYREKRLWP